MVETALSLEGDFNSDRLKFNSGNLGNIADAVATGFRINTSDESVANKLDGEEYTFKIGDIPLFSSELDSEFKGGFSEVNTSFKLFDDVNTAVSGEPEIFLERSNLQNLPESVPKSSAIRRYAETGNKDTLDLGISNFRDVFRGLNSDSFSLIKTSTIETNNDPVNNQSENVKEKVKEKVKSSNKNLGLILPVILGLTAFYYVVFK